MHFSQPSMYDVDWEAYEIRFTMSVLFDPVGGSSSTLYRGWMRADGSGFIEDAVLV